VADERLLSRYRFGTETADFFVCARCGVVPFVTSRIGGRDHAVVNVHSFEGVDSAELSESVTDFEGETTESRIERRRRNWIPDVEVHVGTAHRF
jgi:hypothetical protein